MSKEEGQLFAQDLSALYMECSAKTKAGIQAAFEELVHTIMHSPKLQQARRDAEAKSAHQRLQMSSREEESHDFVNNGCSC